MELSQDYISKFKLYPAETLFGLNWEALKEKRCPVCGCKLYLPRDNKSFVYCKSKKHSKFRISFSSYSKICQKK